MVILVNGDVVDVLVAGEDIGPGLSGVGRKVDAAHDGVGVGHAPPCGEVEAVGVVEVDSEAVGAVEACGRGSFSQCSAPSVER